MRTSERTISVYTATRKSRNGFSFISVLVTISIVFITIPFTTYLIQAIDFTPAYDQLAVNQFFFFLRDESLTSVDLTVEPDKLTFQQQDESVATIEQYDDRIIRQVDDTGFEVFLRHVDDIHFTSSTYGLDVSITILNGDQFDKTIMYYE